MLVILSFVQEVNEIHYLFLNTTNCIDFLYKILEWQVIESEIIYQKSVPFRKLSHIYLYVSSLFHSSILLPSGFTGIDAEYEAPIKPDLVLKAGEWSEDECVQKVVELLRSNVCLYYGYIFTIVLIIHTIYLEREGGKEDSHSPP